MTPTRHRFEYRFYDEADPGQFTMPQVGLMPTLEIDFVDGQWHVQNVPVNSGGYECAPDDPAASHIWKGKSDDRDGAILDWLADRLGLREGGEREDHQVWVEGRMLE